MSETSESLMIQAPQSQIDELRDLQEWLSDRQFDIKVDAIPSPPDPRGQPHAVLTVLFVLMSTPMAVEFAKKLAESLHVYIRSRIEADRPKLTVTLTAKEGGPKVVLELNNPQSVPELTNRLLSLGGGTDGSGGGGTGK